MGVRSIMWRGSIGSFDYVEREYWTCHSESPTNDDRPTLLPTAAWVGKLAPLEFGAEAI